MLSRVRGFSSVTFGFNAASYAKDVAFASSDPERFWMSKVPAENFFFSRPKQALPLAGGSRSYFPGGTLNSCWIAVTRHVEAGRGGCAAFHFHSSLEPSISRSLSYAELEKETSRFAAILKSFGVGAGDCVMLYAPQMLESAVAMLAAARVGAPHCVVFAGFAPEQLAARIRHVKPKVIVTCDFCREGIKQIPLVRPLDAALESCPEMKPQVIVIGRKDVIPGREQDLSLHRGRHAEYAALMKQAAQETHPCVPVPSEHPLYYLHTSGTTGQPKALMRDSGGHAVALNYVARDVTGLEGYGNVMWAASDIGWVVGHSFGIYGPLFRGATSLLVEGKPVQTPDHLEWFRILERYRVSTMFCAPTAIRAIRKEAGSAEAVSRFNLSSLRAWFVAGEKCDLPTKHWLARVLGHRVPVLDNYWQTETGYQVVSEGFLGSYGVVPPLSDGAGGLPLPGFQLSIRAPEGEEDVQHGKEKEGDLVVKLPLPPGCASLLGDTDASLYHTIYTSAYPGYYKTGDSGFIDVQQDLPFVHVLGRIDDVINVAGHRLTTGQIEEACLRVAGVAEAAVVAVVDNLKGHVPVVFFVGYADEQDVLDGVRQFVGAVASVKSAFRVQKLPKTRSGKTLRATLAKIANHESLIKIPPTIEDESVLDAIIQLVKSKRSNKQH